MTALALFLMCISFLFAFLSFFPEWAPEEPDWLRDAFVFLTKPWVSLGCFFVGFIMIFIFG